VSVERVEGWRASACPWCGQTGVIFASKALAERSDDAHQLSHRAFVYRGSNDITIHGYNAERQAR
jgi:hypothetical protein